MSVMDEISKASFWASLGALLLYLAGKIFEGRLTSSFARKDKLVDSSLGVKTGLRSLEQTALVDFRLAVEEWEYFLQSGIGELTMRSEIGNFEPADFHDRDVAAFGKVRLTAVKATVLLRNRQLETEVLETISRIRQIYYPLIQATVSKAIALQADIAPFALRMKQFEDSGLTNLSVALKPAEAAKMIKLRHALSAVLANYCADLVNNYKPIAEQLYDLKEKINVHVYRDLVTHQINEAVTPAD